MAAKSPLRRQFERNIQTFLSILGKDIETNRGELNEEDKAKALHLLTYAFRLPDLWPEIRALLLQIAAPMERAGHRNDWRPYLEKGLSMAHNAQDRAAASTLQIQLGLLDQYQGDFQQAYDCFSQAVQLARQDEGQVHLGWALNRMAYAAKLRRRLKEAESLVNEALSHLPADHVEVAHARFIQGTIALDRGEIAGAITFLEEALMLRRRQGNKRGVARCYRTLGVAYFSQGTTEQSVRFTQLALELFVELGDSVDEAVALMNLGAAQSELGQWEKAIQNLQQAEPVLRVVGDKHHLAMLYNNIGYIYQLRKHWSLARDAYIQCIDFWHAVDDREELIDVLDDLGKVYLALEESEKAKQIYENGLKELSRINDESIYITYKKLFESQLRAIQAI